MPVKVDGIKKGVAGIDITISTLKELFNMTEIELQTYFSDIVSSNPEKSIKCDHCGGDFPC